MNRSNIPKISIVTICFNAGAELSRCIESVLSQTYQNIEYILIDGGSGQETLDIIENYKDQIDHYVSEKDRGIADAFNKGLALASGDYIGFLNSDDLLASKDSIELLFESYSLEEMDIYYGNVISFNNESSVLMKNPEWGRLPFSMSVYHPAIYIRTDLIRKVGGFDISKKVAMDYDLLLRIFNCNPSVKFVNRLVSKFSIGGVSTLVRKNILMGYMETYASQRKYSNHKILATFNLVVKLLGLYCPRPIALFLSFPLRKIIGLNYRFLKR